MFEINKKKIFLPILLFFLSSIHCNEPKQEFLLLITGCGRSGTGYISKLLTETGLKIGHERLQKDGISSWPLAIDSSYSPFGPSSKNLVFKHTFHQVRNPLNVISSWYNNNINSKTVWNFICLNIPEINQNESFLIRCAKYWYYWNLEAEKKAEWIYRIEDIDFLIDEITKRLELIMPLDKEAIFRVSKKYNSCAPIRKKIKWSDLKKELTEELFTKIQALAHRYGYSTQDIE